jgi:hypothetical protein
MCVVAACSGGDDASTDSASTVAPVTTETAASTTVDPSPATTEPTTSDPVAEEPASGDGPVQDLWILTSLEVIREDGSTLDVLPELVELASTTAAGTGVALGSRAEFTESATLAGHLATVDGGDRGDVHVAAGLLETPTATMVTFIATPLPGGRWPDTEDVVRFALPDIDGVEPGHPLVAEYQFVQVLPDPSVELPDDGSIDDPVGLAAARLRVGAYRYAALGEEPDAPSITFTNQIGQVVAGDDRPDGIRFADEAFVAQSDSGAFGELPAKARPYFDGFGDGLKKCLTDPGSGTDCVENVFDGQIEGFGDALDGLWEPNEEPAPDSPAPDDECRIPLPGIGCSPVGFPIPPWLCEAVNGCGAAVGDPHLRTFDGLRYDLQLVGEFVLARATEAAIEVQIRTTPVTGSRQVSVVERAAVAVADHVIEVPADASTPIWIDGTAVEQRPARGEAFVLDDVVVRWWMSNVDVYWQDLPVARISRSRGLVDVYVDPVASPGWVGLLGDPDGDPANDLVSRDGVSVGAELPDRYDVFAASWRVSDEESLLSYEAGESTATFTDPTFPVSPITAADLSPAERKLAAAICREAGITDPVVYDDCVLDFALTGEVAMVRSAQTAQAALLGSQVDDPTKFSSYVDADATVIPGEVLAEDRHGELATGEGLVLLRTTRGRENVLRAIEQTSGAVRWSVTGIDLSVRPVVVDGLGVAVQMDPDQAVVLLALDDGRELAREPAVRGDAGYTLGLVSAGSVVLQADRSRVEAFDAAASLEPLWTIEAAREVVFHPSTAVIGSHVLLLERELPDTVRLRTLDLTTGADVDVLELTGGSPTGLHVLDDRRVAVPTAAAGEEPYASNLVVVGADGQLTEQWHRVHDDGDDLGRPQQFLALGDLVIAWANISTVPLVAYDPRGEVAWIHDQSTRFLTGDAVAALDGSSFVTADVRDGWLAVVDTSGTLEHVVEDPPRTTFLLARAYGIHEPLPFASWITERTQRRRHDQHEHGSGHGTADVADDGSRSRRRAPHRRHRRTRRRRRCGRRVRSTPGSRTRWWAATARRRSRSYPRRCTLRTRPPSATATS